MWIESLFNRLTLKIKLLASYLIILGIGGLVTSLVGSWIVSSTIMEQAWRKVNHDLVTARAVYNERLNLARRTIELAASGTTVQRNLAAENLEAARSYLDTVRLEGDLDFLSLCDARGKVLLRVLNPGRSGDGVSSLPIVRTALSGRSGAATEIFSAAELARESENLKRKARFEVVPDRDPGKLDAAVTAAGMVLTAAAPLRDAQGEVVGALYGGVLLNRNYELVDQIWQLLYEGEYYGGVTVGAVTIFLDNLRIATNLTGLDGDRAIGTRVSPAVEQTVLQDGEIWRGRSPVVNDWYITAYWPIRDSREKIVGILGVGLLEKAYTSISYRVILSFFAIATLGYILIAAFTYYMIRSITRPLAEMAFTAQNIAAGHFAPEIQSTSHDEIGLLASSFNTMLRSLRQMKQDLEDWARTLEAKVKERTEELVAMQTRVAQSERLASLGKLAAGVAHEINNPLGGILALSSLTLEDLDENDPNRENLQEVIKQTERCRDIVMGLLEFSRQSEAKKESVDLNRILRNTLSLVENQALFHNIKVAKQWDPELPAVFADQSQLQQVFMNVIMNAVQAMGEKGTLSVMTRRSVHEGFVEVEFSDTGTGISEDKIGRIFDPFFTTKASGQGTGLGLSIAYGIVAKHGGNIGVESVVGSGTTFTIRLPVLGESDDQAE